MLWMYNVVLKTGPLIMQASIEGEEEGEGKFREYFWLVSSGLDAGTMAFVFKPPSSNAIDP